MTALPTFPLNVSKFIVDTLRLPPIAKAAYLMILLDYCAKGEPPPDNEAVLNQIAGLTDHGWFSLIRPLFDVRDGRWYHAEIEAELARAKKVADNAARASEKAAEARSKRAPAQPLKVTHPPTVEAYAVDGGNMEPATPPKPLAFQALDSLDDFPTPPWATRAVIEKIILPAAIREELGPRRAAAPTTTVAHIGKAPPPPEPELPAPEPPPDVMPIPDDFALDGAMLIQCRNSGADMDDIAGWLDYFRSYNIQAGTLSDDWTAAWWRYFDRKLAEKNKAAKPAKPAPRIEVSRRVAPPPS